MHRKVNAILWAAFVICVVAAIALWFPFHNANPEFEAVKAKVVSAETTRVRNTKRVPRQIFTRLKLSIRIKYIIWKMFIIHIPIQRVK